MHFGILGPVEAWRDDGEPVALGGPRVRALLALLALDAGEVVGVQRLIDELYGDDPPAEAANALQSQVSRLRRALGAGGLVEHGPTGYRLVAGPGAVDAHRFERLAGAGRRALAEGDPERAAALLRDALALWRGPVPAAGAARLAELRLAAVEDRIDAELALGAGDVAELRELVAAHPLRERPWGLLMRALDGTGRRAEALAVYAEARRVLAEELGTDPSPELAAVHLELLRGGRAAGTGLPAQLTTFVGREEELRRVGKRLAGERLVTVLGPGGVGKTRLAVEAGGRERGDVCFVDLAPLGDGAEVPQAMLSALGLRESRLRPEGSGQAADRLVAALADRRLLLILDNCEHVIDAAARIVHRLLAACPGLRVLATSREPLGITGEGLHPLPPLTLPPDGVTAGQALGYPAVRLFADRAAAARPDFSLGPAELGPVLNICSALDGLPLAIELAAARLRALPAAEIAARLDDRFRLLSRGSRTAAPRHQTLRAVVEWSWDLLTEEERVLARRLTVFAGGATLESAREVCGPLSADAADTLSDLVDKSLVIAADGRYRMLETIRTFCAERLAEAGELDRLHAAHADHLIGLAEAAEPRLREAGQLEWLARLDAERDDLHAALRRAVEHGDVRRGLRLAAPLVTYWLLRGLGGEGAALAHELLLVTGTEPPADLAEEYALCALTAIRSRADRSGLRPHLAAVEALAESIGWLFRRPLLHLLWATYSGPPPDSFPAADVAQYMEAAEPWVIALGRLGGGLQHTFSDQGDWAAAEREVTQALAEFRALGDRWGTLVSLGELAVLIEPRGDRDRAWALMDEAVRLAEELGALLDLAELLCGRGDWRVRAGELDEAAAEYRHAAAIARRSGGLEALAIARTRLGDIARLRGDLAEADRLYEQALADRTSGFSAAEAYARGYVGRGRLAVAQGDAAAARAWLHRAVTSVRDQHSHRISADSADGLAEAVLLEGDAERAAALLGLGAALRGTPAPADPGIERTAARCRAELGPARYAEARRRGGELGVADLLTMLGVARSAEGA
ncbi:AfsR/SARP family transcriptional regulator [Actinomadura craniellae]|uniref:AfsR/SARP family transcriptional regulator n=1 Tax=Actinomadura craniellae TaxID=2231787 RepID=A0A365H3T7_9ACTN|nr:BTAD domain-containing putative transcriptional regulator [Actinomadura craniellae]RAY13761.1 AfsR/SARP family transcriptional regulator [Actinomadura craniellae]